MPTLERALSLLEGFLRLRGIRRYEWQGDGVTLSYHATAGKRRDRTLVLVHGLGSNTLSWVKVFGRLGREHRVYAIDLPGWGRSPMPAGKDHASIPDQVAAVIGFLESIPETPVVLVGQSMGGWVCAKVAAARPDLVEHLVLTNNAGVLYPEVEELRHRLDLRSEEAVHEFWTLLWHQVPSFYRYFKADYVSRMQARRVVGFFESLKEDDFINNDLPKLTMPVTIIWGMSDRFIPSTTVDLMLAHLHNATVHWLPRCGHIPALERPREFSRIVNASLRSKAKMATTPVRQT